MVQLSFGLWWENLSIFTQIYWMIAIPSSIIFLIQLALSFKGHKVEKEKTNSEDNIDITFQLLSFKNIIGFFTFFAWSGLACIDSGLTLTSTIIVSIFCGLAMMLAMAIIFYFMGKLMKTVNEDL